MKAAPPSAGERALQSQVIDVARVLGWAGSAAFVVRPRSFDLLAAVLTGRDSEARAAKELAPLRWLPMPEGRQ